jgi:hypothetical protein
MKSTQSAVEVEAVVRPPVEERTLTLAEREIEAWGRFEDATISLGVEYDRARRAVHDLLQLERERMREAV